MKLFSTFILNYSGRRLYQKMKMNFDFNIFMDTLKYRSQEKMQVKKDLFDYF